MHGDYRLSPYDCSDVAADDSGGEKDGDRRGAGYFRDRLLRTRLSVSGDTPRYDASIH